MKNTIFIFEYVSGGGFNQIDIPNSLFCEGFGMLNSIIEDFKSINFEISTLLDSRIKYLSQLLSVDHVELVSEKTNLLKKYKSLVNRCDYVFIIAPESSNILYNLTKIIKKYNKTLLSTNLKAIKIGSSKLVTDKFFQENKISTPKTYLIPKKNEMFDLPFIIKKINIIKKPIIIKPNDGVGAESIYLFETEDQIRDFFHDYNQKIDYRRDYILQEYIKGKDLSASLIGLPSSPIQIPLILSINSQDIHIKNSKSTSEYFGGFTPIEDYQDILNELTHIFN
ncbi:MAG: ATP-grasp domain-containing protein, partial [Candidatus Heimdallarchaeota archaeon]